MQLRITVEQFTHARMYVMCLVGRDYNNYILKIFLLLLQSLTLKTENRRKWSRVRKELPTISDSGLYR